MVVVIQKMVPLQKVMQTASSRYHNNYPEAKQIKGKNFFKMLTVLMTICILIPLGNNDDANDEEIRK